MDSRRRINQRTENLAPSSINATASCLRRACCCRIPPSALIPRGTCEGATIGAKALAARYRSVT